MLTECAKIATTARADQRKLLSASIMIDFFMQKEFAKTVTSAPTIGLRGPPRQFRVSSEELSLGFATHLIE